jgi:hypothetical protein
MFGVRNTFHFLPKNSFTYLLGRDEIFHYLPNIPLPKKMGANLLFRKSETFHLFQTPFTFQSDYQIQHFHNHRLFTQLHLDHEKYQLKEYFYVKPDSLNQRFAKVDYGLQLNGDKMYQFSFNTTYDPKHYMYKYAVFDKYILMDIFQKKYLPGKDF